MAVTFGKRHLGDGYPCFITFEAGPTHDGLESAKNLVKLAAEAGADAIKFQIFDPDKLVADKTLSRSYEVLIDKETGATDTVTETLYDILSRRCLNPSEWKEVKEYSDEQNLAFFATVGFEEDIKLLEDLNCDSIKIASADVNHWPLIRMAAKTGMCIQLDTGNATIGELEDAVEVCRSEGNNKIVIHNCPTGYPARLESINLNIIPTLKRMFPDFPIAFSDHTPGWEMDIAAVAIGANLVEKTITIDRTIRSIEHLFSLEPQEMQHFVRIIRDVEKALGQTRRVLLPEERKMRLKGRRSAFLKKTVTTGEKLSLDNIEFRRPGYGIAPNIIEQLHDLKYVRNLEAGHQLSFSDLEEL